MNKEEPGTLKFLDNLSPSHKLKRVFGKVWFIIFIKKILGLLKGGKQEHEY